MRNKIFDEYQSGNGYRDISKASGRQQTMFDSDEPAQELPAYQKSSTTTTTTHPGRHKRTQNNN